MAYADSARAATATLETIATLIEGIFSSGYGLTLTAGPTPTYGGLGSLTYTSVTTTYSKYVQVGKIVIWFLSCTGTTGGVNNNGLTVSAPVTPKSSQTSAGGALVYPAAGTPRAGMFTVDSVTGLTFFTYDNSNFGLGAARAFVGVVIYEAA